METFYPISGTPINKGIERMFPNESKNVSFWNFDVSLCL